MAFVEARSTRALQKVSRQNPASLGNAAKIVSESRMALPSVFLSGRRVHTYHQATYLIILPRRDKAALILLFIIVVSALRFYYNGLMHRHLVALLAFSVYPASPSI